MTYSTGDPLAVVIVAAIIGAAMLYNRVIRETPPEEGTVEHVAYLYKRGDIDEAEMERRLDVVADPRADQIREATQRVSGIGPDKAWALAVEFESLDELRRADTERLTDIHDIGESTAEQIAEEFQP